KKAGFPLLSSRRVAVTTRHIKIRVEETNMNFDPQIVAQAALFVNALRSGQQAHVPAMPFRLWPVFIGCVRLMMRASA
ncbi:hypothetical protein, partial [Pantoea ananatis]|uniref:hypothetical protein n=1 Tax=Pantoea ananas TaxID=553 RepID=UPI003F4A8DB2